MGCVTWSFAQPRNVWITWRRRWWWCLCNAYAWPLCSAFSDKRCGHCLATCPYGNERCEFVRLSFQVSGIGVRDCGLHTRVRSRSPLNISCAPKFVGNSDLIDQCTCCWVRCGWRKGIWHGWFIWRRTSREEKDECRPQVCGGCPSILCFLCPSYRPRVVRWLVAAASPVWRTNISDCNSDGKMTSSMRPRLSVESSVGALRVPRRMVCSWRFLMAFTVGDTVDVFDGVCVAKLQAESVWSSWDWSVSRCLASAAIHTASERRTRMPVISWSTARTCWY